MRHASVRSKLLVPLALGILALAAGLLAGTYWNGRQQVDSLLEQRQALAHVQFAGIVAQESDLLLAGLGILGGDQGFIEAFERRDRDELLRRATPVFERLRALHGITHLYFTDTDRVNFLRVHRPDLHGDTIDRYTTMQAVTTGEPFAGLEVGRYRALLTLRGVMPWYDGDRLIGYLEMGREIEGLAARLGGLLDVELAVYLRKGDLVREYWEAGMRAMQRDYDWDQFKQFVRVDSTLAHEPDELNGLVSSLPATRGKRFASHFGGRDLAGAIDVLADAQGEEIGGLAVMVDVTSVRSAATRLVVLVALASAAVAAVLFFQLERLDRTLRRVADENERLQANLLESHKLEAVGRLAGGVAHDFNNALTAITGYAELALSHASGTGVADDLRGIITVARRVARITGQLLAFARRQHLVASRVEFNKTLRTASDLLQPLVGSSVEIDFDLEPRGCDVIIDPGQIDQVLLNLVVNANDAMPDGGRIQIRTRLIADAARARPGEEIPSGRFVELSVTDTGTGMDAKTQARIFEPFFSTKGPAGGTGLGLATVYGITTQHGGHLRVDSEIGKGTTFRLYFPIAELVADDADDPVIARPQRERPRVLLVDDEPAVLAVLERLLQQSGCEIVAADSAAAAREHFLPGDFDLLLTDVMMPHQRGDQLYADLRRLDPTLRVLFMSGYPREAGGEELIAPEAPFIGKPIDRVELMKQIGALLG